MGLGFAAALVTGGCVASKPAPPRAMGLFTTLPILWPETGDLKGLLRNDTVPHWALAVLAARGALRPLDMLAPHDGQTPLAGVGLLVMAQPRPLSPQENVALDDWVRRGGRLLLFADPMLTQKSEFALGDRRRPQQIALLSPILSRWGLELQFDNEQSAGEHAVDAFGGPIPVNLPGIVTVGKGSRQCEPQPGVAGLYALCRIGKGRALVIADAALFEAAPDAGQTDRAAALERVLAEIDR